MTGIMLYGEEEGQVLGSVKITLDMDGPADVVIYVDALSSAEELRDILNRFLPADKFPSDDHE